MRFNTDSAVPDRTFGASSAAACRAPGPPPVLCTLGNPAATGYPMGVVIASRTLIEAFQAKFGFFSTFGGNPVAAAAALAVLEVLDREQLMANAAATRGDLNGGAESRG